MPSKKGKARKNGMNVVPFLDHIATNCSCNFI